MPKTEKGKKRMVVEEVTEPVTNAAPTETVTPEAAPSELKVEEPKTTLIEPESSESVLKTEEPEKSTEENKENTLDSLPPVEPIMPVEPDTPTQPVTKEEPSQPKETKPVEPPHETVIEPIPELTRSKGTNPLIIIIPGLLLLGALLGGIYFYQKGINGTTKPSPTTESAVTATNSPTIAPTPAVTLDLTKYPVNILNGSGIVGEAGRVKTLLSTAGFTISGTGNAASYDFTKTVIKAKVDVPADFITKLSTSLSKSYILDTNQVLATSSADKVQVIVGSSKAK